MVRSHDGVGANAREADFTKQCRQNSSLSSSVDKAGIPRTTLRLVSAFTESTLEEDTAKEYSPE